ncbi:hypothetical protein [Desulfitobacterium metallireducens]|uniref:Molybdopterin cofactor biosynthesis MoaD-related C-terminal domain-containing protein n=1 Tax=Desulfitobacterium metallireducens DSM 15288 TaxID=871968 RepID=W0E509_9FIRM|nr:hypothetical protein [Desulfitobacterium metallireducens]AHF05837.1 hypothetical protein DESME_01135 [Desulfitobacterium metallireducens DSM 15288]
MYHYTQTLEMRGIKRQLFLDYFLALGGNLTSSEHIQGPNWKIHLGAEQAINLGSIRLPVVHITFEADEEAVLHMVQAFRFRFLSAGG